MTQTLTARSASDRTDDWPFWMVWDGVRNVTSETARRLGYVWQSGAVLTSREFAERLVREASYDH